jgi:hypothetical protein
VSATSDPRQKPGKQISSLPEFRTLKEYADHLRDELQSAGWFIHESPSSFGVGSFLKNGKPKKAPSVAITLFDRTTESVIDPDVGDFVQRPRELTGRERPWRVDSWRRRSARTFASLHVAMSDILHRSSRKRSQDVDAIRHDAEVEILRNWSMASP